MTILKSLPIFSYAEANRFVTFVGYRFTMLFSSFLSSPPIEPRSGKSSTFPPLYIAVSISVQMPPTFSYVQQPLIATFLVGVKEYSFVTRRVFSTHSA